MYRAGRIAIHVGIALVIAGMVLGFGAMFTDADSLAVNLIGLVPLGFVLLLAGVTVTQLMGAGAKRPPEED